MYGKSNLAWRSSLETKVYKTIDDLSHNQSAPTVGVDWHVGFNGKFNVLWSLCAFWSLAKMHIKNDKEQQTDDRAESH